jgi:divalent metal cation (Fe/Co/Zn/Cd) transporter
MQGKSRMEPVGIIIFSALMATVSVELLIQSVEDLINGTSKHIDLGVISIVLVGIAIGM